MSNRNMNYKSQRDVLDFIDNIPLKKVEVIIEEPIILEDKEYFNLNSKIMTNIDSFDPKNFQYKQPTLNNNERLFDDYY
jgi:hypothetical protein